MNEISEDDLFYFLMGKLPVDRRREIEQQASGDRKLAAKIEVLRVILDIPVPEPKVQTHRWLLRKKLPPRLLLICVAFCMCGIAGAGWIVLTHRPLLFDNFEDGWFNSGLFLPPVQFAPNAGVAEDGGVLKLFNRGYLITKSEFSEPITVSFDWKYINHNLHDPIYADHLTVTLRSSGKVRSEWTHETADGVRLQIVVWGGNVAAHAPGATADGDHMIATGIHAKVPMPPDVWFHVTINDDGNRIKVFLAPRGSPSSKSDEPILSFTLPASPGGPRHVCVTNRENVGGVFHESWIDNFKVEQGIRDFEP